MFIKVAWTNLMLRNFNVFVGQPFRVVQKANHYVIARVFSEAISWNYYNEEFVSLRLATSASLRSQ